MTTLGIVLYVFLATIVLIIAIIVHELAHALLYWRITKHKPHLSLTFKSFKVTSKYNFEDINNTQYKIILWGGIIAGATVILLATNYFNFLTNLTMIALYIAGCKGDLQRLKALGTET